MPLSDLNLLAERAPRFSVPYWCFAGAFFMSGAAALTYQISWNRYLFAAIGVDLDSTSVIISAFMLGLGLGNVLGAWLAQRALALGSFVAIELMLLAFGLCSPVLMPAIGDYLSTQSRAVAGVALFFVLLFPTLLMGATLPVMTEAAQRSNHAALARSNFSALYLYNTVGAAFGAFLCGFVLLGALGIRGSIYSAALANLAAALLCVLVIVQLQRDASNKRGEASGFSQ